MVYLHLPPPCTYKTGNVCLSWGPVVESRTRPRPFLSNVHDSVMLGPALAMHVPLYGLAFAGALLANGDTKMDTNIDTNMDTSTTPAPAYLGTWMALYGVTALLQQPFKGRFHLLDAVLCASQVVLAAWGFQVAMGRWGDEDMWAPIAATVVWTLMVQTAWVVSLVPSCYTGLVTPLAMWCLSVHVLVPWILHHGGSPGSGGTTASMLDEPGLAKFLLAWVCTFAVLNVPSVCLIHNPDADTWVYLTLAAWLGHAVFAFWGVIDLSLLPFTHGMWGIGFLCASLSCLAFLAFPLLLPVST